MVPTYEEWLDCTGEFAGLLVVKYALFITSRQAVKSAVRKKHVCLGLGDYAVMGGPIHDAGGEQK